MNTKEILLNEGLKYFKLSKKIEKYITTVEGRMATTAMEKNQEEKLNQYIDRLRKLSDDIKKIENEFSNKKVKKDEAQEALNKLKKDNAALITTIQNKSKFQKAFPYLMQIPSTLFFINTLSSLFGFGPLKFDIFSIFGSNPVQTNGITPDAGKQNQSVQQ